MPNIEDINGVAAADIGAFSGVSASNIASINGLTLAAAFTGLLDTYTNATAAYSVRQLKTGVTISMRVRRETAGGAGDDDEADVAFDTSLATPTISLDSAISNASAGVTATTLGQFLNVGTVGGTTYTNPDSLTVTASCWVDTFYDQSGNADHIEQATVGSQPQLHSGTTNTDLIQQNSKPALYFPDYTYQLAKTANWGGTNVLTCDFVNVHTLVSGSGLGGGASSDRHFLFWFDGAFQVASIYLGTYYLDWSRTTTGPTADTNQHLWYGIASNGTGQIRVDGTAYTAGTLTTTRYFSGQFALNGRPGAPTTERGVQQYQQEFIQWDLNQSASNRTGIESNINSEYLIYQPTDAPTSGLLATYTGAAAAYSVRQLSDKAVIAMRIRRDSDDEERNIGFDANGDLDTTAISDFCQTANGYVTRWWDQSTNGKHTDQSVGGTTPQQPLIYNGTAVITENGKPAIQFDGTNDYLPRTQNDLLITAPWAAFITCTNINNSNNRQLIGCAARPYIQLNSANKLSVLIQPDSITQASATAQAQQLFSVRYSWSDSVMDIHVNGSLTDSATPTATSTPSTDGRFSIGSYVSTASTQPYYGTMQEVIIFTVHENDTNRSGIESDIMTHFSIT